MTRGCIAGPPPRLNSARPGGVAEVIDPAGEGGRCGAFRVARDADFRTVIAWVKLTSCVLAGPVVREMYDHDWPERVTRRYSGAAAVDHLVELGRGRGPAPRRRRRSCWRPLRHDVEAQVVRDVLLGDQARVEHRVCGQRGIEFSLDLEVAVAGGLHEATRAVCTAVHACRGRCRRDEDRASLPVMVNAVASPSGLTNVQIAVLSVVVLKLSERIVCGEDVLNVRSSLEALVPSEAVPLSR